MPTLRQELRTLPRAAWILYAGSFVNRFGTFVVPFLVLYLTRAGHSPVAAGGAVGAYGLGSMVAAPVGGYLADRLGRRRTIALSMFSAAATMLVLSQARALPAIAALVGLAGFTSELYRPAATALIADTVPREGRLTALAVYRLAVNAGFAFGPAVGGLLAERSFFWLFVGDGLTSAAYGVIALVALPEGRRTAARDEPRGAAMRALAHDRTYLLLLVAVGCVAFLIFQSQAAFALHVRANGLSNTTYGLLLALNGVLIVAVELPIIGVTRRLRARPVIAAGCVLIGIGFALTGLAHTTLALAATVAVWTLGEMVYAPVANAYATDLAPPTLRGRYQGALTMMFSLGFSAGSWLGTAAYQRSPALLWTICAGVGLLAAALVLLGPERRVAVDIGRPELGPELPGVET